MLLSVHEGTDEITITISDHQVDLSATFFTLDELVVAVADAVVRSLPRVVVASGCCLTVITSTAVAMSARLAWR